MQQYEKGSGRASVQLSMGNGIVYRKFYIGDNL